jgi:cytochrome P450
MTTFEAVDIFTDESIIGDPYPFFEFVREQGPVWREPHHGVFVVSGYDEACAVYRDHESFSSCNAPTGPFPGFPMEPEGDDVSSFVESYRDQLPMHDHMVTFDPPRHGAYRGLMTGLLTPKRLKENEDFMWRLSDRQLDEFVYRGHCEFIHEYSRPFAVLVIADLLGVPEDDRERFRQVLDAQQNAGKLGGVTVENPLAFLDDAFSGYIEDRRREPRGDVLTHLALARFPDGSTPEVLDLVREATFLFGAGQETTARLLAAGLHYLGEHPNAQQLLRDRRQLIPTFIEETLRTESSVKSHFRYVRRTTSIGGVKIPAGSQVMLLIGAVNRDPRRFYQPGEFRLDRAHSQEHVAFGRGIHSCLGGPLARAEARVSLERILDRMADIRISEAEHGPPGARYYEYDPTYILRGLAELHLEFTPVDAPPQTGREQG